MTISSGRSTVTLEDILDKTTEADILSYYLNIKEIPCVIKSPLREDKKPSFGLYSRDGKRVFYVDLSTGDKGGLFDLLSSLWNKSYREVLEKIYSDIDKLHLSSSIKSYTPCHIKTSDTYNSNSDLQCKIREWRKYDIEYWESFGISLKWLKYADVYPISHKIIIKDGHRYTFGTDKYAYVYVEHKEGRVTLKIYQPFNKDGYKWANKHDNSVISLWTKVPEKGDNICICSSLKDALCLWANTGIPSIAVQGEGYIISNTAINELKRRYKNIYIIFDNDEAGITNGIKLSHITGFHNIVLPKLEEYNNPKDISDIYYSLKDKEKFKKLMLSLINKN